MKSKNYLLRTICLLYCLTSYSQISNSYKVIYAADKNGNVISGNREKLVEYVNNGNPIRVGWDLHIQVKDSVHTMTHWADAGFITILEGHVFAQIKSIYRQGPKRPKEGELPAVFLSNAEPNGWVAIIGTTGIMRRKSKRDEEMIQFMMKTMTEKEIEESLKKRETITLPTKWAILTK